MSDCTLSEKEFLRQYDPNNYLRPSIAVDTVIYTVLNGELHVLLVKRANHPFQYGWSLVGGFIDIQNDANLEATAKRKLKEKTGVNTPYLEQFATIGNLTRDPRGWSVTTVYFALIPSQDLQLHADLGAIDTKWEPVKHGRVKEKLAFDHAEILLACTERLRSKVLYTSLPVHLMSKTFTLSELQKVYEIIVEKNIDPKSFRRRIMSADILEETGMIQQISGRPAQQYQLKENNKTYIFVRTIEGARTGERASLLND